MSQAKSIYTSLAKSKLITALCIATTFLVIAHLITVIVSPPGFYLDEAAGAAHAVAMLHHGTNAFGTPWPLFSEALGGGYTTPIYLYPLVGWMTLFGTSELAIRYFSVICTLLAIALLSAGVKQWLGNRDALLAAVVALSLPWGWLQGSLAWDPALVPLFVSLAFVSFTLLYHRPSSKFVYYSLLVIFPASLIALAYLYPPMRVSAPLLFTAGYAVLLRHNKISWRSTVTTCLICIVTVLPLIQFMIQPSALERSANLSVFHDNSILSGIIAIGINLLVLINPIFLFVTGDNNLRHSTGIQGMLGIASVPMFIALVAAIVHRARNKTWSRSFTHPTKALILISIVGIATIYLSSALTNEGQPHSLRASGAWPFFTILIVIGWRSILSSRQKPWVPIVSVGIFLIATIGYIIDLTAYYPSRSADSFDTSQRAAIYSNKQTPGYPDLSIKYYQTR